MGDGAVITMDEICDELDVPPLPLLEDMPPEIEITFREDERESEKPGPASPD